MNPFAERLAKLTVPPSVVGGTPIRPVMAVPGQPSPGPQAAADALRRRIQRRLASESESEIRAAWGDR